MDSPTSPTDPQESSSTLFFCRICQSVYKQPKILPCLHSFCRPCLVETVSHSKEGTVILCPVCSHRTSVPPSGIVGVPDNCFLSRLCQEYLSEVQSHLVARSLNTEASNSSAPSQYTALRPRAAIRESRYGSAEDASLEQEEAPSGILAIDRGPASGQSTAKALEAIRNMSRLQNKILNLQGEALRVTYAIDQVNQSMQEWHQHKEDLKRAVQRRSAQFQFFIKRMEHQLINQIEGKHADDEVYAESDKCKVELRTILKNVLHEVSVLKCIQELGNDDEINTLSAYLLGKSIGMADVGLKKCHFDLDVPSKPIEEIIAANFGQVKLNTEGCNVLTPNIQDYTESPVGNLTETSPAAGLNTSFDTGRETPIPEDEELGEAVRVTPRRSTDRRARRHKTDLGLAREDVREYLAQFQTARESFRTRRREILAQGQQAREDTSPLRGEMALRPRSLSRKGRVQSVDRATLPISSRDRAVLPDKPTIEGFVGTASKQSVPLSDDAEDSATQQVQGSNPEDRTVSSSVAHPTSPLRRLVKQTSDPRFTHDMPSSPKEPSGSEASPPAHGQSVMEHLRNRRFSNPTTSFPFGDQMSLDLLGHDRISTRPVRRAISNVTDKRAKIDFLRETWQKRKEILIQNQGFVSPDSSLTKVVGKPSVKTPPSSPTHVQSSQSNISQEHVQTTSDDPNKDRLHQIKSRLDHFKSELTKTNVHDSGMEATDRSSPLPMENIPEEPASPKHQPQSPAADRSVIPPRTERVQLSATPASTERIAPVITAPVASIVTAPIAPATTVLATPITTASVSPATTAPIALRTTTQISSATIPKVSSVTTVSTAPSTTAATTASSQEPPAITKTQVQATSSTTSSRYTFSSRYTPISPRNTTTTTTSSRYSRPSTQSSDSFDVASLIAAMYSGNEKAIIHSTTASTTSSSSPTTAKQDTSPRFNTMTTSSSTTLEKPSESVATTTTTSVSTTRLASTTPYRYRYQSRYGIGRTSDQVAPSTDSQTALTTESQAAMSHDSQTVPSKSAQSNGYQTTLSVSSSRAQTSISETVQPNDSSMDQSITSQTTQSGTQTAQINGSQTDPSNSSMTADSSQQLKPRVSRFGLGSRDSRRRHTTAVGKETIQEALRMISESDSAAGVHSSANPAATSSAIQPASQTTAHHTRIPFMSRPFQSTDLQDTKPLPISIVPETDEMSDSTISVNISAKGVTTRTIPSPLSLEQRLESRSPDLIQNLSPQAVIGRPKSPIPSPTSPSAGTVAMRGKLRELARKKKERWRHLTIH